jgi:asparagine synthase (glutamine-hydrolysing)
VCGICGVFGREDRDTLGQMLATLVHRGPDDEHIVGGPRFGLGARRLSIIDVEGGRQPIADESRTVWAAHNGEIYNFRELRRRLQERGHLLRTRCDSEVLPHLYEEYGVELVDHLEGMFAVAIWDDARNRGLLVRDRLGKKPLYYTRRGDILYFASEIKALLRVRGLERRIDLEALHHFLSYKHVPHPWSIFEGIRIVPPGHRLLYRPGNEPVVEPYWQPDFTVEPEVSNLPEEELVDRLIGLLRRGIQRRLVADVPIAFFLSGGVDSSLAAALASELAPGPVTTFTLTYEPASTTPGKEADRHWARWVADRYRTDAHETTISSRSLSESLPEIVACFDEPFAGVVSTYFLARHASRHVKVAVSGDGADELFGSYLSHRLARPLANYAEFARTGDTTLIHPYADQPKLLGQLADSHDWGWRSKLLVFDEAEKRTLYSADAAAALDGCSTRDHLKRTYENLTATDPLNRVLEAELRTMFPDQVLTYVDRLSMAHSLEVRTAYLDTEVVNFVAGLSGDWKIRGGQTKYLLKKAALRYLPAEMVFRKKEGFLMPVTEWLVKDLQEYVRGTLSAVRLARHGLFDATRVGQLVDELYRPGGDFRQANKVLVLLAFQAWHDRYFPGA